MAILTKAQLEALNQSSFPDQSTEAITPAILRNYNTQTIDTLVDSLDTGSFATTSSVNAFTSSQNTKNATLGGITGSLLTTASVNLNTITFTKQDSSTFAITVNTGSGGGGTTDISALNAATASLNAFTSSQATQNSTLASITSSLITSASNSAVSNSVFATKFATIGGQTGSYVTSAITASSLVTASVAINVITFTKGDGTTFNLSVAASGSVTPGTVSGSAQIVQLGFLQTSSFQSYTASQDTKNSTLATYTASVDTKFTAVSASTASLNSATASLFTSASLGLTTASVNLNTITFTKGDKTTFAITVNTGSGGGTTDISALNAATASLNAFTASQANVNIAIGASTSSLNAFSASQITKDSTLATYTASVETRFTAVGASTASLNSATASLFTSASLGLTTASFSVNTLTFRKGDGTTFGIVIPDVSGSGVPTGTVSGSAQIVGLGFLQTSSFNAYTQSNDTKWNTLGGQTGSYITSAQTSSMSVATASVALAVSTSISTQNIQHFVTFVDNSTGTQAIYVDGGIKYNPNQDLLLVNNITSSGFISASSLNLTGTLTASLQNGYVLVGNGSNITTLVATSSFGTTINTGSFATTGSNAFFGTNSFSGAVSFTGSAPTILSSSFSGSLITNLTDIYTNIPPVQQIVTLTSASYAGLVSGSLTNPNTLYVVSGSTTSTPTIDTGSFVTTSSFNSYTASQDTKNITLANVTASLNAFTASQETKDATLGALTGSFATTGSNVFTGIQTFQDAALNASSLVSTSGSLMLVAKSFTSASSHISASSNALVNLIFKNNSNTPDTILSGSNNIFVNAQAPTAGFKRYLGPGNIALNPFNVPQITGSMGFSPTLSTNYFGGNATTLTMRGPVSSSAWTISGNSVLGTINVGSSDANHARGIQSGLTLTGNNVAGTLNIIANSQNLSSSVSITNTVLNGTATINANSSSVTMANNNINDAGFVFTNNFFTGSAGLGSVAANRNNIGGQVQTILVQGTQPAGTTTAHSISDNTMLGGNNTIFIDATNARVSGSTAYFNALRNIIGGNQLIVSASSLLADVSSFGSAYFGRYNADDAIRNKTSDIVFAVGTGTSTTRKTGFLIDSGSNTFVEGTLNVSGSTTMTGSLILSSSNAVELFVIGNSEFTGSVAGNLISASITSNTASIDFNLGNYFELTSSVTPLHLNITNIKPGTTSTLILSASASSSILFSPNVAQPSGSAYSGSLGSIDILSLVAFSTSKVNLVATKALV